VHVLSLSSDEIDDGMSVNICTTHTVKKKEEQHILEKIKSTSKKKKKSVDACGFYIQK